METSVFSQKCGWIILHFKLFRVLIGKLFPEGNSIYFYDSLLRLYGFFKTEHFSRKSLNFLKIKWLILTLEDLREILLKSRCTTRARMLTATWSSLECFLLQVHISSCSNRGVSLSLLVIQGLRSFLVIIVPNQLYNSLSVLNFPVISP